MRIINLSELLAQREGVVFSPIIPGEPGALLTYLGKKGPGDTDFEYSELQGLDASKVPTVTWRDALMDSSISIPLCVDEVCHWNDNRIDRRFVLYERADLVTLIDALTVAVEVST